MKLKYFSLMAIAISMLYSCSQPAAVEKVIRPVKVSEVVPYNYTIKSFSGVITPDEFSFLAFKMSGPLISVEVNEGEKVKKGDVIARLDPMDYQLDFDAKKASYITAKASLERAEKLLTRRAISVQDYETSQANFENAKAAYANSKTTLEQTVLTAPFDGFIQQKFVENYQKVGQGERIVCLINPDKLLMQATLPENIVTYLNNKTQIFVEFDTYKGVKFKAKVRDFVEASPDGSGLPIFVYIDDPDFSLEKYNVAVGFSCTIELLITYNDNLGWTVIPISSIVTVPNSDEISVFVYNSNNSVSRRVIKTDGVANRSFTIVTEGLKAGERIVSAGATRLVDGESVKLLTE